MLNHFKKDHNKDYIFFFFLNIKLAKMETGWKGGKIGRRELRQEASSAIQARDNGVLNLRRGSMCMVE